MRHRPRHPVPKAPLAASATMALRFSGVLAHAVLVVAAQPSQNTAVTILVRRFEPCVTDQTPRAR
jgi:hypothetical protein